MRFILILAVIVSSGCGGNANPKAKTPQQDGKADAVSLPNLPDKDKLTVRYQGQTADHWFAVLQDADGEQSMLGGEALAAIGEEGVPFLLQGMKSKIPHVRAIAVFRFPAEWAKSHRKETVQLLRTMLGDEHPTPANNAGAAVARLRLGELEPDLLRIIEATASPDLKNSLENQLKNGSSRILVGGFQPSTHEYPGNIQRKR